MGLLRRVEEGPVSVRGRAGRVMPRSFPHFWQDFISVLHLGPSTRGLPRATLVTEAGARRPVVWRPGALPGLGAEPLTATWGFDLWLSGLCVPACSLK